MILAFIRRVDLRHWVGALVVAVLAYGSSGCGSPDQGGTGGAPAAVKGESRIRVEGTGKNKTEVLIRRRDERVKRLQEEAKKG